jgi:hypothetical protein
VRRIQPSLDAKGRVAHWRCSGCRWTFPEAPGYAGLKAPPNTFYQFQMHDCAEHQETARLEPVDVVPYPREGTLKEPAVANQLNRLLAGAVEAVGTPLGGIQLYDVSERALDLVAVQGFDPGFKARFRWVHPSRDATVCAMAFRQQRRVSVEDIFATPELEPMTAAAEAFGFAACTCTPLREKDGRIFGMLSTHFVTPYVPSAAQLAALDRHLLKAVPGLLTLLGAI